MLNFKFYFCLLKLVMKYSKPFQNSKKESVSLMCKKQLSHIIFFSIIFLLFASAVCPIIHNNDYIHDVHPLVHSAVCKWVKEGKICRNSFLLCNQNFITVSFLVVTLTFFFIPKDKETYNPFKKLYFVSTQQGRSPPF